MFLNKWRSFIIVCLTFCFCNCTYIEGDYNLENDFFKLLIKFGFSKTEKTFELNYGYIFGNITSDFSYKNKFPVTLAVLDRHHFLEFYSNRTISNKNLACQRMFARLNYTAYDKKCNTDGKGDYLRRLPCPKGQLCIDEDNPKNLIQGSQFTYVIMNQNQPRFWYVSIVSCYRNQTTCEWEYYDHQKMRNSTYVKVPSSTLHYSINLVNGHPNKEQSFYSPFIYQFSFDQQNILEQFIIFFVIYFVLVPIQIHGVRKQKHPLTKLFTFSLILEFISILFILIHLTKFSVNGVGNESLKVAGDIFDILSRTSFMLVLLLLAKGWAVTRLEISNASWIVLIMIWLSYCTINVFLYIWNQTEVDVVSDIDEYQTWPGWLVIISRSMIMLWFLWELRNTMKYEHSTKKLDFLLHFGASSLVWFIYLPIIALIALQVSPLWRSKLLLAVTNSVDCLAYFVLMSLLWPDRSGQYILLANRNSSGMDELDEFNEAPHVLHRESFPPTLENNELDPNNDLDGDIDTLVLSTDDLLVNNVMTNNSGDNLLILNGDRDSSQLIASNNKSRSKNVFS